jgi:uncharacterized membrane protein YjfL (UPF0719 family)
MLSPWTLDYYASNTVRFLFSAVLAVLAVLVSAGAFALVDKTLLKRIDFLDEIAKGNVAAGIFGAGALIAVAIVIGSLVR